MPIIPYFLLSLMPLFKILHNHNRGTFGKRTIRLLHVRTDGNCVVMKEVLPNGDDDYDVEIR